MQLTIKNTPVWVWPNDELHILGLGFFESLQQGTFNQNNSHIAYVPKNGMLRLVKKSNAVLGQLKRYGYVKTDIYVPGSLGEVLK